MKITIHTVDLRIKTHEGFLNSHDLCWNVAVMLSVQRWVRGQLAVSNTMKWNKWGSTPHLYTYRLNWVRRTWGWWDEWGVTALQTQDSKLSPVGLRPSTLTLGHGGCPQYSIFTIEQGGNILFLWNLNARAGDESAISDFPSRHQDTPPPPPALLYCYYIYTNTLPVDLILVHNQGRCPQFFIIYSAQHIKCA